MFPDAIGISKRLLLIVAAKILVSTCTIAAQDSQGEFPVKAETFPVANAGAEVCILSFGTEFKERIRSTLIEELNSRGIAVTVDSMDHAASYDPDEYDVVILLSGIAAFRPLPEATKYIRNYDYPNNIVYFSTYSWFAIPYGFALDKNKIDAVTSASTVEDTSVIQEATEALLAEILAIIDKK